MAASGLEGGKSGCIDRERRREERGTREDEGVHFCASGSKWVVCSEEK